MEDNKKVKFRSNVFRIERVTGETEWLSTQDRKVVESLNLVEIFLKQNLGFYIKRPKVKVTRSTHRIAGTTPDNGQTHAFHIRLMVC